MLFVEVTQMYNNRGAYLCSAILVTEIFCYQYLSLITPLRNNFSTKFGVCFGNLLKIRYTKFYSGSFRFDISIIRCLGGYFFSGQSVDVRDVHNVAFPGWLTDCRQQRKRTDAWRRIRRRFLRPFVFVVVGNFVVGEIRQEAKRSSWVQNVKGAKCFDAEHHVLFKFHQQPILSQAAVGPYFLKKKIYARKLLLSSHPTESRRLSWAEHAVMQCIW